MQGKGSTAQLYPQPCYRIFGAEKTYTLTSYQEDFYDSSLGHMDG
jgi:hypothetical protein